MKSSRELSRLKFIEDTYLKSDERYKIVIENSPLAIYIFQDGNLKFFNQAFVTLSGYTREELSGLNYIELIHPDFRNTLLQQTQQALTGDATGLPTEHEIPVVRKNKEIRWTLIKPCVIEHDTRPAILGFVLDVTERRLMMANLAENEAKYHSFFRTSLEGVGISKGNQILDANAALLEIFGYDSLEEFKNIPLLDRIAPESMEYVKEQLRNAAEGKRVDNRFKYWIIRKDGEKRLLEISTCHVNPGDEMITYSTFRDITERQKAEDQIRELYDKEKAARQELEEEAKARAMFTDILAHELRTPLTPILTSTSMLQELLKPQGGIQEKLAANILSSAETLAQRLEDLLDLARCARGTFKLRKMPADMYQFVDEVIARFQPSLSLRNQKLVFEICEGLPVTEIDPSRIEQVLINLLSNASKFSPQNSVITLKVSQKGNEVLVEVKDEGIGISNEDQETLFRPYHRVQQDRNLIPGMGLGLAVSKQIIEAHGGKIWVTSQTGCGSTFSFLLPL
jgi:PAS domain S-box-containing protein